MIVNLSGETSLNSLLKIKKRLSRKDVSRKGAFSGKDKIEISLYASRRLALTEVNAEIFDDNTGSTSIVKCDFSGTECGYDVYTFTMDFRKMCPDGDNLVFWKAILKSETKVQYTDSINNVDFNLTDNADGKKFRQRKV